MRRRIKAIVVDLDDTLLRRDKTLSDFTVETLEACHEKGVKLLFATGRGSSAARLVPMPLFDGIVLQNGALGMVRGKIVYERMLEPSVYVPFLQAFTKEGILAAAEIHGVHFANFNVTSKWDRDYVRTDFSDLTEKAEKFYAVIESPEQRALIEKLLPKDLHVHFTKDDLVLVSHREATKVPALMAVLKELGLSLSQIVAFGDDRNDIEMLCHSGVSVAMENALEEVKSVSGETCGDCDQDGVAEWITEHLL